MLTKLGEIHDILREISSLAESGDMPPRIRSKVKGNINNLNGLTRSLRNWAITHEERETKKVKEKRREKV